MRNDHGGNQCRAPVSQKHKNDEDDEQDGNDKRPLHLENGGAKIVTRPIKDNLHVAVADAIEAEQQQRCFTRSTAWMMFAPGWRKITNAMAGLPLR